MDLPVYKLNAFDSSYNFGCNYDYNTKTKVTSKDTQESALFSQESQLNASNNFDKKDNFWKTLRKLWSGNNSSESENSAVDDNFIEKKFNFMLNLITDVERNLSVIKTKIDAMERKISTLDRDDIWKKTKSLTRIVQKLGKKSVRQNDQCSRVLANMESLEKNVSDSIDEINSSNETLYSESDDLVTISSSEIKSKFQSILDNVLSDLSSESIMQWNNMLKTFYSQTLSQSVNTSRKTIGECSKPFAEKSPGECIINSLRRSERIQNKNSFGKNKPKTGRPRFRNTKQSIVYKNVTNTMDGKRKLRDLSTESKSIKRSIKIFKYYEESRDGGDTVLSDTDNFEMSAGHMFYGEFSNNPSSKSLHNTTKDCDSDLDVVSLRRLFEN